MSFKAMKFALVGLAVLAAATSVVAAPIVTMTQSTLVRPQVQGAGTYNALDFFYSSTPGAEFLNYRLIVNTPSGNFLFDPARLQDDRQTTSVNEGNTSGSVDTFASTVMAAAAKEDGGFNSSLIVNAGSYNPSGSGAAPPFALLDWDVFDTEGGDDNNLADHPGGPFAAAAPYRLARVLAGVGATGTARFIAFDSLTLDQNGAPVGTTFNFNFGAPPNTAPDVVDAVVGPPYNNNEPGEPQTLTHQFLAIDAETPLGPFTWDQLALQSFTPNYGGTGPDSQTPFIAPTLSSSGLFEWVSEGSRRGDYVWSVRATDPGGLSGTGTITVHATHVPEPSTIALCGLAMVGFAGLFRRRNG